MRVCSNCGTESPHTFKFCPACATSLDVSPTRAREERKVVSVLFVDLVGFVGRFHDADPEDVRAALSPYYQRLKTEIEHHGGTVEKFIGDAVVGVFGAPVTHEDDAERAVRAALRAIAAIEELNESEPGLNLSIRAAVNTGEGLVSVTAHTLSDEGRVTGDVINIASRLQALAPVNGVLVGEVTHRVTTDAIAYEELVPVLVKGASEPIPVWRAVSPRSRVGVDVARRYRSPFVGRRLDLATLKTAFERTMRESCLQLVTVVGEPGVGKSRLVAELFFYADGQPDPVTWRQGRSLPYGDGITFWALGEIVKAEAGVNESDSPEAASDKLSRAVARVAADEGDRAWLRARIAPLVGAVTAGEGADQEESFTAWVRFLEGLATMRPLVLVFEDLHWADASLLEFLEHLVAWSTGMPILLVCTSRPELFESRPHWSAGVRNASTISLSPLADAEIAQLVSALMPGAVLPAELHAHLLEQAEGNPLYVEEFVRVLGDQGALEQFAAAPLDLNIGMFMPDNLQALIAARLDNLPPERKSLLHDASVVGKVFWSGAVATLGGIEEATARRSLQELVRSEFLRPSRFSSIRGQQEYSFWHALIRDVAYGQIPRLPRARSHERTAQWLESHVGERIGDHAEIIAHHYEQAREILAASGRTEQAEELEEQAIPFLILAGDKALDIDVARAQQHLERVWRLLSSDDPRRPDVLMNLGRAADLSGRVDEAIGHYQHASDFFHAADNKRGEGEAACRLWGASLYAGLGADKRRPLLTRSAALLEATDPSRELAWAYNQRAISALNDGEPVEAVKWAEKAAAVAEAVRDGRELLIARLWHASARCELGDLSGLDDLQQVYEESLSSGWAEQESWACGWLSGWLWSIEGPSKALTILEGGLEREERRGLISLAMLSRADSLAYLYETGEWDKLLDVGRSTARWAKQQKLGGAEIIASPYMVQVLTWREQTADARLLCDEVLPKARRETIDAVVPALAAAALIGHMQGETEEAIALIEELELVTNHSAHWRSRQLPTALRILVAAGRIDQANDFAHGLKVFATRNLNCVLTGQAILTEAQGEVEEARDLYREAAERWADFGFVLEQGQAHLGLARSLLALGDREPAAAPLGKARGIFSRLGAVTLVEETDGYLLHSRT
jgi:class 3 adenylate cyclase/tetratricopeptide (TPR) repeat protein